MHPPNADYNTDPFFARLAVADQAALMLDYDGTLAPFTVERDRAYPYPGVRQRLNQFAGSRKTRLIIVSGRRSHEIPPLLGLDPPPEIWGQHGAERRLPDGNVQSVDISDKVMKGLSEAEDWAKENGLAPLCERKPISLAFHWRGLPKQETGSIRSKVWDRWEHASRQYGIELRDFDGGLELKVAGIDKGRAVKQILSELTDDAIVAYLGDDRTDEDAFMALAGNGLSILVRTEECPTAADLWIKPPGELLAFLDRWLDVGL